MLFGFSALSSAIILDPERSIREVVGSVEESTLAYDEEEDFDFGDEYPSNDTPVTMLGQADAQYWCPHCGWVGPDHLCGPDCRNDMSRPSPQPTFQPKSLGEHECKEMISIQSYIKDDEFFTKNGEVFDCKKCDTLKMRNKMHARDHAYAKHVKGAPIRYKCLNPKCGFTTKSQSSMQRHQRNAGKKKAKCPACGIDLSRWDYLPKHLKKHCSQRPNCSSSPSTPSTSTGDDS